MIVYSKQHTAVEQRRKCGGIPACLSVCTPSTEDEDIDSTINDDTYHIYDDIIELGVRSRYHIYSVPGHTAVCITGSGRIAVGMESRFFWWWWCRVFFCVGSTAKHDPAHTICDSMKGAPVCVTLRTVLVYETSKYKVILPVQPQKEGGD